MPGCVAAERYTHDHVLDYCRVGGCRENVGFYVVEDIGGVAGSSVVAGEPVVSVLITKAVILARCCQHTCLERAARCFA